VTANEARMRVAIVCRDALASFEGALTLGSDRACDPGHDVVHRRLAIFAQRTKARRAGRHDPSPTIPFVLVRAGARDGAGGVGHGHREESACAGACGLLAPGIELVGCTPEN